MLQLFIVEDEETMRDGLVAMIDWEAIGIQVCGSAANGLEALELLGSVQADLLLTDIRMPLMDGLQLIGEVRKRGHDIACVLLSGYNDFEYAKQALRLGVSDFLVKPCSPLEIRSLFVELTAKIKHQRSHNDAVHELQETMPAMKSQLLQSWLHAPALVTEDRAGQMKRLKLSITHQHPIVMIVQMDNRSLQQLNYSRMDLELIRLASANIVKETLEQIVMQPVETIKEEDGIVIILNGVFEWIGDKLNRGLDRVQENLRAYLKISVSIGISDSKPNIDYLAEAYREARQALDLRFFRSAESRSYYRDVADAAREATLDGQTLDLGLMKLEQSALDNLSTGLYAEALNDIEHWLATFQEQYPFTRSEVNVRTLSLLTRILRLVQERGGDMPSDFGSLEQQVSRVDTLEELSGFVFRILRQLVERLNPHRVPKRKAQQALDYIAANYNSPGLSLAGAAKELFVSSTYLSTLFKQELGVNFLDYVHQYRIDKAKVLLQSTDDKIQAIAKEVGYFDEAHFTKTFKKWTGTLPSQYRRENARRD